MYIVIRDVHWIFLGTVWMSLATVLFAMSCQTMDLSLRKAEGKGKGGGRGKGKGKGGKGVAATIIPGPLSPFQAPPMMRPMGPMPGMPSMPVSGMPGGMPVYPFPQGPRGVPSMPGMPGMRPFGVPGQMPHPMPHAMPHRPMMPMPGAPGAPMPGMPAPMPPPAALGPFNKEAIEKMPPQQQKQQLGERLYASNFRLRPDLAGKLTGMMLELFGFLSPDLRPNPPFSTVTKSHTLAVLANRHSKKIFLILSACLKTMGLNGSGCIWLIPFKHICLSSS